MIYCELKDEQGEVLYSTICNDDCCSLFKESECESYRIGKFKQIYKTYPQGSIRLIGDEKDQSIITSKIATRTMDIYASLLPMLLQIKEKHETQYSIFSHNLITTHSRLQDEIESIAPEEKLARATNYIEQVSIVKESLMENPDTASESVFEIAKRIIDLQSQITGFKILSGELKPSTSPQDLKKVLLNIIYPYYDDFKQKGITIKMHLDDTFFAQNLIPLDYKLFNIALHHFFNNIIKYALPDSYIEINFDSQNKELIFSMLSLRIEEDELDSIFHLKVSGKNTDGIPGDGIGMFMIQKSLNLLSAKMKIVPDYTKKFSSGDKIFNKNIFSVCFKND